MSGWIKLHRKLLENAIFYKADYYQVWSYILLKVNFEDNQFIWNNEKKLVEKGSGIFSQKKMAEVFGFDISKISRILKFLENENQIQIKTTNKFTEIKVLNWIEYQEIVENGNQKQTKNKPKTNPAQIIKKDKKEEKEENDKKESFSPVGDPPEENNPELKKLYPEMISVYDSFIKKITGGAGAKINGMEGQAMKQIIEYLKRASKDKTDEGILNSWNHLLASWGKLDNFYQGKLKLVEINSNMVNLINQIKNGKQTNGNTTRESEFANYFASKTANGSR